MCVLGGWSIQKECQERVEQHGKLRPGEVFVSHPGRLQCNSIAHALGVRWSGGTNGEKDVLQSAVTVCLQEASRRKYKSIAIPALSTGMYGFPLTEACTTIVEAVNLFLTQTQGSLQDVYVCDIVTGTVQAFVSALTNSFKNTKVLGRCIFVTYPNFFVCFMSQLVDL